MRYVDTWVCPECELTWSSDDMYVAETDSATEHCPNCLQHNRGYVEVEVLEYQNNE